jgi:hypothetical protein
MVNAVFVASLAQRGRIHARKSGTLKLRSMVVGVCATPNPHPPVAQISASD